YGGGGGGAAGSYAGSGGGGGGGGDYAGVLTSTGGGSGDGSGGDGELYISWTPSPTSTTIDSSSATSIDVGQTATLVADVGVTNGSGYTPTGQVTFEDSSGNTLCTATLNQASPDQASCTITPAVESIYYQAVYGGDSGAATSSSGYQILTVSQDPTSTGVTASAGSGTSIDLEAATSQTSTSPAAGLTGSVTFEYATGAAVPTSYTEMSSCGTDVGNPVSIPGGQSAGSPADVACTFAAEPGMSYWFEALYSGDGDDVGSTGSTSFNYPMVTTRTTLTETAIPSSNTYGGSYTFAGTVQDLPGTDSSPADLEYFAYSGSGTPAAVACTGSGQTNPATVAGNGDAGSCTFAPGISSNEVYAEYLGDSQTSSSSSSVISLTITPAGSSLSLALSPVVSTDSTNSYVDVPVTISATVTNTSQSGIAPDGTVTFSEAGTVIASCTGVASSSTDGAAETATYQCTSASTPASLSDVGFSAEYCAAGAGGTCAYWDSASGSLTDSPQPDQTATALTCADCSTTGGSSDTVTAAVSDQEGTAPLDGTVSFVENGSTTVCPDVSLTSDEASCTFTPTPGVSDSVVAEYAAGSLTAASTSNALSLSPAAEATTTSIAVTAAGTTVAEGGSMSYGTPVVITASVKAGGQSVTAGSVTFTVDGVAVCSGVAFSGTTASCDLSDLAVGTHDFIATFTPGGASGSEYASSSSSGSTDTWTVDTASTSTAIGVGVDTTGAGEIALTATVADSAAGSTGKPHGTVAFFADGGTTAISGCSAVALTTTSGGLQAVCDVLEPTVATTYTAKFTPSNNEFSSSVSSGATFTPGATCSAAFTSLWDDAGTTVQFGVGPLGTGVDSVSVDLASETGLCNPINALPFSRASVSLFGSTVAASSLGGYVTDGSSGSAPTICLTSGSLSLPAGWHLASISLSATADLCMSVTAAGAGGNTLGLPVSGALTISGIALPFGVPDSSVTYDLVLQVTGSSTPSLTITLQPESTPVSTPYIDASIVVSLSGSAVTATGTATLSNLPFGTLDLSFTVSGGASGSLAGSITGEIPGPYAPIPGVSLTAVTVTLSSTSGLSFSGTATFGSNSEPVALTVSGGYSAGTFTLNVSSTTVSWSPFASLAINASFSGSVTITTAGKVTFDVEAGTPPASGATATPIVAWDPVSGLAVDLYCLALSYGVTPTCNGAADTTPSDPTLSAIASITVGSASNGLTIGMDGSIDLASGDVDFALDPTVSNPTVTIVNGLTVTINDLSLSGKIGSSLTFDASASADISAIDQDVTVAISNNSGALVVAVDGVSLASVGVPLTGFFAYASGPVASYATGDTTFGTVALSTGFNAFVVYTPSAGVTSALKAVGFSAGSTIEFTAAWDPGSSPTLTATLSAPPGFPFLSLPNGGGITSATLSWASDNLSIAVTGTIPVPNQSPATIVVSLTLDTSTGAISGTATLTGLQVFGQPVTNFTGSVSWSSSAGFSGSLTADIAGPFAPFSAIPGLEISNLDISLGTSGLTVSGDVSVEGLTIAIDGSLQSFKSWSLSLSVATTSSWTPVPGVTIGGTLTGSITDANGAISFDVTAAGSPLLSFTVSGVTVSVSSVEFGNGTPPNSCSVTKVGDLFLTIDGSISVDLSGVSGDVDAAGCFDLTTSSFLLTASIPSLAISAAGGAINIEAPTITFGESGGNLTVDVQLQLVVSMPSGGTLSVTVSYAQEPSDNFVVGGEVDLSSWLGTSAANAYVYYASAAEDFPTGTNLGTLDLKQGLTFGMDFALTSAMSSALSSVGINVPSGTELVATITLDFNSDTYTLSLGISFGAGITIFSESDGTSLVLNSGSLFVQLSPGNAEIGLQLNATLNIPPSGNGGASTVAMTGQLTVGTNGINITLTIGTCGDASAAWQNAFGDDGLTVECAVLGVGILPDPPFINLTLAGTILGLPSNVQNAIGYNPDNVSPGPPISFAFQIDPLLVAISIGTEGSTTVALEPFEAFGQGSLLEVYYAGLYFAPVAVTVGGVSYPEGVGLGFQGSVEGVQISVIASVGIAPPHLQFDASVSQFTVGPLTIGPVSIALDAGVDPLAFSFEFSGSLSLGPGTATIIPGALKVGGEASLSVEIGVSTSGFDAFFWGSLSVWVYNWQSNGTCWNAQDLPYACDYSWNYSSFGFTLGKTGLSVTSSALTLEGDGYSLTFNYDGSVTVSGPNQALQELAQSCPQHLAVTSGSFVVQADASARTEASAACQAAKPTVQAAKAPIVGSWTPTGTLAAGRAFASLADLPGGDVLVAGGAGANGHLLASAEVYDPVTKAWTTVHPMATARTGAVTTVLPDGDVLVAGGLGANMVALSSAEIYHPSTGTWTTAAAMPFASAYASSAVLADGDLLVAGGISGDDVALADAALYDPQTGRWSSTGSMQSARALGAISLTTGGRVLVAGGWANKDLASAEIYHPSTGTWSAAADLPSARSGLSAAALPSGDVLVVGGSNNAAVFHAKTGKWSVTAASSAPFDFINLVALPDGDVLGVGGMSRHGTVAESEVYDPHTGKWSAAGTLARDRYGAEATVLSNGQVLEVGGARMTLNRKADITSFAADASTELYSLTPPRQQATGSPPPPLKSTKPSKPSKPGTPVPPTSTGQPWASPLYWFFVVLSGLLGLGFVERSTRRRRRRRHDRRPPVG
ncbi:MAG: kelch repeat-containing protein, partial [Acidimicrobiales bacterium]